MEFKIDEEMWKANRSVLVALLRDNLELLASQEAMLQLICELLPSVTKDTENIMKRYNTEKNRIRLEELQALEDDYPELAAEVGNEPPLRDDQLL